MREKIVVCDLSAIENRVLGYLSRCDKITNVFRMGRDPYIDFDSRLRKIDYEVAYAEYKAGNKTPRTNAKPAVLGAGYGLGGGEEIITPQGDRIRGGLWGYAKNMGIDITREFAHESVRVFRSTYDEVPVFWTDMEEGFKHVLKNGGSLVVGDVTYNKKAHEWEKAAEVYENPYIEFDRKNVRGHGQMVRMRLPSGRCLHYLNAHIEIEPFTFVDKKTHEKKTLDGEVIYYEGIEHSNSTDATGQRAERQVVWGKVKTYGGKLTENAVQAFSRDLLLNGMFLAKDLGFSLRGCFHDELLAVVPNDPFGIGLADLRWCMSEPPSWCPDILLGAEGYESTFYHK